MKKIALSIITVSLLFIGCSDEKKSQNNPSVAQQMPAVKVKTHVVKFDKATFAKSYPSILKPSKEVAVVARVSGTLIKENFIEGSFVKEGDILYEIQKDEYKATLDEAKASLLKAQADFNKASKDWSRSEFLFKNSAVSEQQRDEVFYIYENTKAEVKKAQAALKRAEINYGYTTIKAPISGIVGLSSSDKGSYIESQNSKLTTITAQNPLYAEFSIPKSDISRYASQVKNGAIVTIDNGGKIHKGIVDFIAPTMDTQTDTLLIRAKFENKNNNLIIGSYEKVELDGFSYENVAIIPQSALVKTPDAILAYVVENDSVSMRPLNILHVKDGMAFISSGVKDNEHVVISNIAKLRVNSKVTIMDGN